MNNLITQMSSLEKLLAVEKLSEKQIFGDITNKNNRFDLISLSNGESIGIVYRYHGLEPQLLQSNDFCFVGFDHYLLQIDCLETQKSSRIQLDSLFYECINIQKYELILVVCELDVYAIDYQGAIIWHIGFNGIIVDFEIGQNQILVQTDDGDKTTISLADGTIYTL